jgi:hypothetical protein
MIKQTVAILVLTTNTCKTENSRNSTPIRISLLFSLLMNDCIKKNKLTQETNTKCKLSAGACTLKDIVNT